MKHRYYTTQRPPAMGCIPKGAVEVGFFADKMFVADIGREAWGYAEYGHKLSAEEIADYELVEGDAED